MSLIIADSLINIIAMPKNGLKAK